MLDGKRPRVTPLLFDDSDGLATTEMRLGSNPGFRAADGRLVFATAGGLSIVDPAHVAVEEKAPRVLVEGPAWTAAWNAARSILPGGAT